MTDISKRIVYLRRREDIPFPEFSAHWSGPHARLALGLPGVTNYIQNHVLETVWRGRSGGTYFDGIAEIEYKNETILAEAMASDLGTTILPEDEQRFLGGWTGCVVRAANSEATPAQRRIIVALQNGGSSGASDLAVHIQRFTAQLSPSIHSSFELTSERRSRSAIAHDPWPDAAVFLELQDAEDYSVLLGSNEALSDLLEESFDTGAAFLVRCETKKLLRDTASSGQG